MCSINGGFSYSRLEPLPEHFFGEHRAVAQALSHRGPDGTGHFQDPSCVLFVNQFKITGLDNNVQPVVSECGRVVSVLNGELYNYRKLNCELIEAGCSIRSNCDAETLNKLYLAYGPECFAKIHGIFGAAIYDSREHRLVLARDRFGQIPLFYCASGGFLHFASESNPLLRFTSRELDQDSLLQYFSFGFAFDHLVKGIKRLRPGTYLIADRDGIRERTLWRPVFQIDHALSERETHEQAFGALQTGVRDLTPAEVDMGIFVSGGIDSATVAKVAEAQGSQFRLFTSGLVDAELGPTSPVDSDYGPVEGTGNELAFADTLAGGCQVEYIRREFHVADVIEHLPRMVSHLPGGPTMSTSFPAFYFSALGACSSGTRVNLTGEGGDELHAGYLTCQPDNYLPGELSAGLVRLSDFTSPEERSLFLGKGSQSRLHDLCTMVDANVDANFHGDGTPDELTFNRLRHFMLSYVFTPHLVEKGNGMAMLGGPTELRMPYLSDSYVDLALKAPPKYLRSASQRKLLLHTLSRQAGVPESIIRRAKQRTSLPYYNLFYTDKTFREFASGCLDKRSMLSDVIHLKNPWAYVEGLRGTRDAHKRAWSLLLLETWFQEVFSNPHRPSSAREEIRTARRALATLG